MQLLIGKTSPYARKARVVILEKNINCDIVVASPWENSPVVAQHNPLRKIPILLTDEGPPILDSRVICEYLDEQRQTPHLLPAVPDQRFAVKTREAIADGAIDAIVSIIMAKRVAADMHHAGWQQWLVNKSMTTLDYFEQNFCEHPLNMADISLGCLLGLLDFRRPDDSWRNNRPQLSRWYDDLSKRPSFQQTIPRD